MKHQSGSRLVLGAALISLAILSACSPGAEEQTRLGAAVPVEGGGSYLDILPDELERMMAAKDFVLVNVHIPFEGEIPGTDVHLPFDGIAQRRSALPEALDTKIVLYCRSGSMSAIAARELVGLGYTQVYNLDGGFRAWIQAGYQFRP